MMFSMRSPNWGFSLPLTAKRLGRTGCTFHNFMSLIMSCLIWCNGVGRFRKNFVIVWESKLPDWLKRCTSKHSVQICNIYGKMRFRNWLTNKIYQDIKLTIDIVYIGNY